MSMQATMHMPPTTHALPQTHRTNLIRSTRKLGAILGETPLLLEPTRGHAHSSSVSSTSSTDSSSSSASKRSGRIFAPSVPRSSSLAPASTHTTFNSTSPLPEHSRECQQTDQHRPMLYLRLADPRPTSISSPISPSFSPLTPTFSPPKIDRRKKMAKLTRTLGQNVPPELVFSSASRDKGRPVHVPAMLAALSPAHASLVLPPNEHEQELASPTREAAGMLRASEHEYVESRQRAHSSLSYYRAIPSRSNSSNSSSGDDGWVTVPAPSSSYPPRSPGWRTNSYPPPSPSPRSPHYIKTSQRTFAADVQNAPPQTPTSPPAHPSTTSRSTTDARFLSRHYEVVLPWVENSRSASPAFFQGRSTSPARSQSPAPAHNRVPSRAQTAMSYNSEYEYVNEPSAQTTYRKEAGWSGEWTGAGTGVGGMGMEEVVRGLRGLRLK
ncbi:hypothetical protein C8R43DRAFT_1016910 [Mycena crocata]|nr:hypothetical protein C8R43DRAFT_1016910 [Mycena crocata]